MPANANAVVVGTIFSGRNLLSPNTGRVIAIIKVESFINGVKIKSDTIVTIDSGIAFETYNRILTRIKKDSESAA